MPNPYGRGWIGKSFPRGAWHYSAEQDVSFCGALRAHATIVTKDPIFGEFAYGAELTREGDKLHIEPKDGLRARLHVIRDAQRLHLELVGCRFSNQSPITFDDSLSHMAFTLEQPTSNGLRQLVLAGLPPGSIACAWRAMIKSSMFEVATKYRSSRCRSVIKPSPKSSSSATVRLIAKHL